jgi:hypothetical protein
MIDTIVLSLTQDQFQILDHNRFNPSTVGLFEYPYTRMGSRAFIKSVQNPTKKEMKSGFYRPRLTVIKAIRNGGYAIEMKIEFSIPKLVFGNNFDELDDDDFKCVLNLLQKTLSDMSVIVKLDNLVSCSVSAVHYSKNIHLSDHTSCSMILDELQKIDLSKRIDTGSEKFRNGGYAIHFHTNKRDIVFYDKLKDLEQSRTSDSKALENDNATQIGLFESLSKLPCPEFFRMEVRLGDRKEIQKIFDKIEITKKITFCEVFNQSVSQKVLNHYWSEVEENRSLFNFKTHGIVEFFDSLKANNPNLSSKKLLQLTAFVILGQEGGTKRLRTLLGYSGEPKQDKKWYDIKKQAKGLIYDKNGNWQAISSVSSGIDSFTKTQLSDIMDI